MLEGFITIILVGSVLAVGIMIAAGFYRLIVWQDRRTYLAIKRERTAAVQVYRMVLKNVEGDLPLAEYNQALRYTIRKYHLGEHGRIEFAGSDKRFLAELITETVNQNRISLETFSIVQADPLSQKNKKEVLTA
ncbi:hypothetical protein [Caproiciproducens sp.]|jgi:hypothetical protein